jgi:hypothetical protein
MEKRKMKTLYTSKEGRKEYALERKEKGGKKIIIEKLNYCTKYYVHLLVTPI